MTTEDDISTEFSPKDNHEEKDQRRLSLLTNTDYGIVLCFLDKFRSQFDLPIYSLQRLEDHLVHYQERIPPRLIDFHFILLKRLSLAKNTQREKFDSVITKFASRFDLNDSEHLATTGYLQADINVKIRILKNLLESQFDLNQTFQKSLVDRPAREIRSTPLGRDRFGVSYWLFMDTDCFVRLFREDLDLDRTWTIIAKDRDELEKFIQLLITDSVVRKKFSDWPIDFESFSSLPLSNEFEERYLPPPVEIKEEEVEVESTPNEDDQSEETSKKKRSHRKGSTNSINHEHNQVDKDTEPTSTDEEKPVEPIKRKRGRPKGPIKVGKQEVDSTFNHHEANDTLTKKRPGRRSRSSTKPMEIEIKEEVVEEEEGEEKSELTAKKRPGRPRSSTKLIVKEECITPVSRGRKRKNVMEENSNDENTPNEETSIRRSTRTRKATVIDPTFVVSSKAASQIPTSKKKRCGKTKSSTDLSVTTKSGRSRRRRKGTSRRTNNHDFCLSSSESDEQVNYPSDEEYDSDDYLPNPSEMEQDDNFFELDEDNHLTGEELRSAKTAQASTIITACHVCSKSDRPEVLLLCDDCDDAYHLECLRPVLLSVPDGDWFCPLCEHMKLANHLIDKLKELLINFNRMESQRLELELKRSSHQRKIKLKEYTSDESVTASESEHENLDDHLHAEDSMLSISQTNENSNISSSHFDDATKNISQRGRHRRTRFDMNKMLNNDEESEESSDTDNDDEYMMENPTPITNFDLQIPKKMTRLLNQRYRPIAVRPDLRLKPKPIVPRLPQSSTDLNDKLGSPIIYINGDGHSHQIKSVITNSNQTLKIARRWNDVQRRNRLRTNNLKSSHETTSDCADENSVFCPDDASPPRSNDSNSQQELKEDETTIIRSKITLVQPTNFLPVYKSASKNIVKKNEVSFDRLTRDIQYAVSEVNTIPVTPKTIDQQQIKRIQKTNFSPYLNKVALRPLPVILPKPAGVGYKIFKSKDPPTTMTTTDLSNIILTPSSSSSLLDPNDEHSTSNMNT